MILELVGASALWGFGFVAAVWAMHSLGAMALSSARLLIAFGVSIAWCYITGEKKDLLNREQIKLSIWPGLFLSATLILQTWGLRYTTPTRSGFITCLYVLLVPILESALFQKRLSRLHFVFVALALMGTSLICDLQGGGWNKGDLITLICAIAASAQIVCFGRIANRIRSAVAFNALQSMWALAPPLLLALLLERIPMAPFTSLSLTGLLALSIGSSTIAFMLQIRAQKTISPSTASMIFLLESPFALLFSVLLLHEQLTLSQYGGAALILVAVTLSTLEDRKQNLAQIKKKTG